VKGSHFKDLLKSIDEARAIKAGKIKPSRVIHFEPLQLKSIRKRWRVSQSQFAHLIGVSSATLRNWEQGRTYPDGAARALLVVASKNPAVVLQALRAA
jgi:putative transcriptional regulator